jgi:hypothetical protein
VKDDGILRFEGYELTVAEIEGLLANAVTDEDSWLGKFSRGLACLVDILEDRPGLGRVLLAEIDEGGEAARKRWSETLRRAARFVDLAREEPGGRSPPQNAANAVVAKISGVLQSELRYSGRPELRAAVPDLVYCAVLPYFGEEVARREMAAAEAWVGGSGG